MPWVRFDDQFPIHRKAAGLSDAAFRLHVSAIFWCARNLTDGFVPEEDLDDVCARVRTPARFAAECVQRRAWHHARESCDSDKCTAPVDGDGWVIHDYLVYQFSREQVERDREAAAKRQKRWREARNSRGFPQAPKGADLRNPHIHSPEGRSNGSSNGVTNAVSASSPPRPERRRGRGDPRPGAASGRASPPGPAAATQPPLMMSVPDRHPFEPDGGGGCETCGLPEANQRHTEAS